MALSRNQEKKEKQLANLRPRKKGDPPLPNAGRPKKLPITEALQKFFEDPANIQAYINAAAKHARNGSGTHFKEINDRVEGKIVEPIEIGADEALLEALLRGRKRVNGSNK